MTCPGPVSWAGRGLGGTVEFLLALTPLYSVRAFSVTLVVWVREGRGKGLRKTSLGCRVLGLRDKRMS